MKMNLSVSLMCLTVPLALVSSGARAAYVAEPDAAHSAQTRRHTGIPPVAVARNGRLWATFYGSPTGGEDSNNYCTLATSADGTIPTYFDSRKGSDWVNCMVYVADRLEALDARTERRSRRVVIGARQSVGHRPAFRRAMLSRSRTSLQTARRLSNRSTCTRQGRWRPSRRWNP